MKTITLKVPDDINEDELKEFALIFVRRNLRTKKEAEIGKPEDLIETEFKAIKTSNNLKDKEERL